LNGCTNPSQVPTYEFTCPTGHDFDKFFRSMASAPMVLACPVCGEPADRKMSAGAGLVFRGSGFYITDYGKDGKKDQKAASSATSESKKDSGGDTKPSDSTSSSSSATEGKSDSGSAAPSEPGSKSAGGSSAKPAETPTKAAAPAKGSE
jgi:putative FmdB family regulatory protein